MTRTKPGPSVEVSGEAVLAFLAGLGTFSSTARHLLAKYGIERPVSGRWYPWETWLRAFGEIASRIGDGALERIGRAIPDNARWPQAISGIPDALRSIDVAYHLNHRIETRVLFDTETGQLLAGIGHYSVEEAGRDSAVVCCDNPYPCAFDLGIIRAVATRFEQAGRRVDVVHLEPGCRKSGARACRYRVTW
jgi:hypothetical protein